MKMKIKDIRIVQMSFPSSLALLGLSPGFTPVQFKAAMIPERSDWVRNKAHQEWLEEQVPEKDNISNYRWYLSYVSMNNEYTSDWASSTSNENKQLSQ